MNITISGYGKMGREIEKIALKRNHNIIAVVDTKADWKSHLEKIKNSDVIIDFSQPDVVVDNIKRSFEHGIPMVVGTTGWDNDLENLKTQCVETGNTLFVASNFSIGMNLFFEVNKKLASLMNGHPEYIAGISETHHIHKKDAPSGTAIRLAEQVVDNIQSLNSWTNKPAHDPDQLGVHSERIGEVPGTHIISYRSEMDEVEIKHTAKSRQGFAFGALLAAEWVKNKKGFFGMKDMLDF